MEVEFWHQKWERGEIGFHQAQANPLLVKYASQLNLVPGSRILLPLCGMTIDISWLLGQGFGIVGVELSQLAIERLFDALKLEPQINPVGNLLHYRAQDIDIFVGNFFDLSAEQLGRVDAIYDRAALVALPEAMRRQYASHLTTLTEAAPQLLITFEYDQSQMTGPPFSVPQPEIERLYDTAYRSQLLESRAVAGGLKGKVVANESIWLMQPQG